MLSHLITADIAPKYVYRGLVNAIRPHASVPTELTWYLILTALSFFACTRHDLPTELSDKHYKGTIPNGIVRCLSGLISAHSAAVSATERGNQQEEQYEDD